MVSNEVAISQFKRQGVVSLMKLTEDRKARDVESSRSSDRRKLSDEVNYLLLATSCHLFSTRDICNF